MYRAIISNDKILAASFNRLSDSELDNLEALLTSPGHCFYFNFREDLKDFAESMQLDFEIEE